MFDKLAPTPIMEKKYRYLMIVAMVWMFTGAWVDSSAHTFLLDEIETFFTPWHALLYTGSVSYTHLTLPTILLV